MLVNRRRPLKAATADPVNRVSFLMRVATATAVRQMPYHLAKPAVFLMEVLNWAYKVSNMSGGKIEETGGFAEVVTWQRKGRPRHNTTVQIYRLFHKTLRRSQDSHKLKGKRVSKRK